MGKIYQSATLTPAFKDFLPDWVAHQPWYPGTGTPTLRPVGYFRFEDPEGEVGIETHLVTDGTSVVQLPMTYRGAPFDDGALIATAEHSVLGQRWIYDAETDPVYRSELLRVIRDNGAGDPSIRMAAGPATAHGHRIRDYADAEVRIDLQRLLTHDEPSLDPDVVGTLTGSWDEGKPSCLALIRQVS
jgi:maltokinase-like protein